MKNSYSIIGIMLLCNNFLVAQSVSINANNLQLPQVSALPTCVAADYGKMLFLTTTNKAQICNATGWVAIEAPGGSGLSIPINTTAAVSGGALINVTNSSTTANSIGIKAEAASGNGGIGVSGIANQTSPINNTVGVYGYNGSTNANGIGVYGRHFGAGWGVFGLSDDGIGVEGRATTGTGVKGGATTGDAIYGSVSSTGKAGYFQALSNGIAGQFEAGGGTSARALYTIGALRFTGINEANGRFLKSDATGLATWQALTRNEVVAIPASAFLPDRNDNEYIIGAGIYFTTLATGTTGTMYAPVNIPSGASITSFKLIYFDNGTPAITSCQLQAATQASAIYSSISTLTIPSTNSTAVQSVTSATLALNIDNDLNIYRIAVTMNANVSIQIYGVEIKYTYTVPN